MKISLVTRREMLRGAGAGLLTGVAAPRLWAASIADSTTAPDTVVFNARVYTVEPGASPAEAFETLAPSGDAAGAFSVAAVQRRAQFTARLARALADAPEQRDDAFCAGCCKAAP